MLSLVIPAYNEEERIGRGLQVMGAHLAGCGESCEIIVVDDGSQDRTVDVVRAESRGMALPVRVACCPRNRGKGYALKVGFHLSRGDRVAFSDADLATPMPMLDRLLAKLDEGYDFALGSRKMEGAEMRVRQPVLRESLGKVFTQLVNVLAAPVSDATCGLKAYRGDVGRDLFARLRTDGWSFDAELLVVARQLGYRWAEVPVEWEDQEGTKVNLVRDAIGSMAGLMRIRANASLGRYSETVPLDTAPEAITVGEGPEAQAPTSWPAVR